MRQLAGAGLLLLCSATVARAQLRPIHPMEWNLFDDHRTVTSRIGASLFEHQRASLAGTEGELWELGDFSVAVRSGRVAVELAGTALRIFEDQEVFADPFGGARESTGKRRRDAGDIRVSTMVLLTPPDREAAAMLRFGTRLPTTDNEVGLERDRTDFFALLGGRLKHGPYFLSGETGVGINGTHDPRFEQSDVLMYSATAAYKGKWLSPRLSLVGHMDGMHGWTIRGNEELSELRLGARAGRRIWVEVEGVYGLQTFSPRSGVMLFAGIAY